MPASHFLILGTLSLFASTAAAQPQAQYIANAGVMITSGDVKIVFDPLFEEDFGQYELAPGEMQRANGSRCRRPKGPVTRHSTAPRSCMPASRDPCPSSRWSRG